MKSFYDYLAESKKEYKFRMKTAFPIDASCKAIIEKHLFKYDVTSVSEVTKTMMQHAPLDFRNLGTLEIYYVDFVTSVPSSSYVLATALREAFNVTDSQLIVRGEYDPIEIEANRLEELLKDQEAGKETTPVLEDPFYELHEPVKEILYGDEYNKGLLDHMAQIKADHEAKKVPAIENVRKNNLFAHSTPLNKEIAADYNAEYDTVKPVHVNSKTPKKGD